MAYRGDFWFDDEDDFKAGCEGEYYCACCGEPYSQGYWDSEGHPEIGIHEFGVEEERQCKCTEEDLRFALEKRGDVIFLDEYGYEILYLLKEISGLEHISEYDVCRISEYTKKTFYGLHELLVEDLAILHAKAWARFFIEKMGGKECSI